MLGCCWTHSRPSPPWRICASASPPASSSLSSPPSSCSSSSSSTEGSGPALRTPPSAVGARLASRQQHGPTAGSGIRAQPSDRSEVGTGRGLCFLQDQPRAVGAAAHSAVALRHRHGPQGIRLLKINCFQCFPSPPGTRLCSHCIYNFPGASSHPGSRSHNALQHSLGCIHTWHPGEGQQGLRLCPACRVLRAMHSDLQHLGALQGSEMGIACPSQP